jgi:hypothetical protein
MKKIVSIKIKKEKDRNSSALSAKKRKSGGPMKHRLQEKDGAKNEQAEILSEIDDDFDCEW